MQPAPPPLRPGPALGLYLRALGRGLVGLVSPSRAVAPPERMAEASAAAAASAGLGRAQRVAGVLVALLGALCLWVLASDGVEFEVAGQEVSLRNLRNPLKLVLLTAGAWFALRDLRRGRWDGPRALALGRRLRPVTRLGLALWAALLLSLSGTVDRVGACLDIQAARAETGQGSTLFSNEWHMHLMPLVEHVAARAPQPEVALFVDDINPRGHLDSFYTYPRLVRMEPALHAWSLELMMCKGGEDDPGFPDPGEGPGLEETLRWAATRGLDVLVARPEGVDVVAAERTQ